MKARRTLSGLAVLALLALCAAPLAAQEEEVPPPPPPSSEPPPPPSEPPPAPEAADNTRLFLRFAEDAALVSSYWLEGFAFLQGGQPPLAPGTGPFGEADQLGIGAVFALNVAEDFEFGGKIGIVRRDPENGSGDTGVTDLDIWGKVRVVTDPVQIAVGLGLSLPTADSDKFLGTGETNVEFFGAVRKDLQWVTLAGNVGLRINQDPDFGGIGLDGENSVLLGAAAVFPVGRNFVLNAEWAHETERYDGLKNDSRLLGGIQYRPDSGLMWRGAVATGLSDGAPDFEVRGSAVWIF